MIFRNYNKTKSKVAFKKHLQELFLYLLMLITAAIDVKQTKIMEKSHFRLPKM